MSDKPNYLSQPLKLPDLTQHQELERTLVHRLIDRNGWEFPVGDMDSGDYDIAVEDVKWFLSELKDLGGEQ